MNGEGGRKGVYWERRCKRRYMTYKVNDVSLICHICRPIPWGYPPGGGGWGSTLAVGKTP